MNAIQRLKKSHPRVWLLVAFPGYLFGTFILFPLEFAIAFFRSCFWLLWRGIREFFGDLRSDIRFDNREAVYVLRWAWKDWFSILKTGKGIEGPLE